MLKSLVRVLLGAFMLFAGVSHFRSTQTFLAQVPPFLPAREFIVQFSGIVEVILGLGMITSRTNRRNFGIALAAFFVVIFPGNVSQFLTHTSAFGLDSDLARGVRLLFQPALIAAALWSTGARQSRNRA